MSIDVLEVVKSRWTWLIICTLLFGALIVGLSNRDHHLQSAKESRIGTIASQLNSTTDRRSHSCRSGDA
jgi:hypothetical protein